MKLNDEGFLFKQFLKNINNNHNIYDNIFFFKKKLPSLCNSPSVDSIFKIKDKEENKNNSFEAKDNNNELSLKTIKKINNIRTNNINKIFNRFSNKIRLKPLSKRDFIYRNILNLPNSLLSPKKSRNSKLLLPSQSTIIKSLILSPLKKSKPKISFIMNFFKDYESDFFPDMDLSNLKYNEYEIYKDKFSYKKLIKDKIIYFKKTENENHTTKLEKIIQYGKFKKNINICLNSLLITFKDMSSSKNNNIIINYPFALLPIFYYKGFEPFIKFLCLIIKVENNFEKISFENNRIIEVLNTILDYQTNRDKEEETSKNFNCTQYNTTQIYKKDKPIELRTFISKLKQNFQKFNNFTFFWTTNQKTFLVTITLPCIHLNIPENKISIKHFIDFELLFYLYKRNFVNWDYYVIKNMSNYSKFRNIFYKIESNSKIYDIQFYLKEPKTRHNSFIDDNIINVYTDKNNNNQIIQFLSLFIIIHLIDIKTNKEKIYHIFFNFNQYVKLNEIDKYSSKLFFLTKFLDLNCEMNSLQFNFKRYDEFDINAWIEKIKKFSNESLKKRIVNEVLFKELVTFSKKIKMELKKPRWSIIQLEGKCEKKNTYEIKDELEKIFIESIAKNHAYFWTSVINNFSKKMNVSDPISSEIICKKNYKKKFDRSNSCVQVNIKRPKPRTRSQFKRVSE
jgi:hypothetical protein